MNRLYISLSVCDVNNYKKPNFKLITRCTRAKESTWLKLSSIYLFGMVCHLLLHISTKAGATCFLRSANADVFHVKSRAVAFTQSIKLFMLSVTSADKGSMRDGSFCWHSNGTIPIMSSDKSPSKIRNSIK